MQKVAARVKRTHNNQVITTFKEANQKYIYFY